MVQPQFIRQDADHLIMVKGHPRDPTTFVEVTEGRNGITRIVRSYVAYDASWPWWRRFYAVFFNRCWPRAAGQS